jgi:hypothetical protein
VSKNAYCNDCGTRVVLIESGDCPNGHPRSSLRDVQDGPIAPAAPRPVTKGPNLTRSEETASQAIGKLIVIVPLVLVAVFGLWTGYALSIGMGASKAAAWANSIGSLVFTVACVAFIVWLKRRKQQKD